MKKPLDPLLSPFICLPPCPFQRPTLVLRLPVCRPQRPPRDITIDAPDGFLSNHIAFLSITLYYTPSTTKPLNWGANQKLLKSNPSMRGKIASDLRDLLDNQPFFRGFLSLTFNKLSRSEMSIGAFQSG